MSLEAPCPLRVYSCIFLFLLDYGGDTKLNFYRVLFSEQMLTAGEKVMGLKVYGKLLGFFWPKLKPRDSRYSQRSIEGAFFGVLTLFYLHEEVYPLSYFEAPMLSELHKRYCLIISVWYHCIIWNT